MKYGNVIEQLYQQANPIIKYKIDKELYQKDMTIDQYMSLEDDPISYWLNVYNRREIHGRKDDAYENAIGKLLEYGLTKEHEPFHQQYGYILENKYWQADQSFQGLLMKSVVYPFLIRGGYLDHPCIKEFLMNRIQTIESTIEKYGYDFEDILCKRPKKYKDQFIFKVDITKEWLPTIYDLYAFAFYPNKDDEVSDRIEKIVTYLLDDRYQQIPENAYIYDSTKKYYYAAGNVYHACMKQERKILMIYLLSHFNAAGNSHMFISALDNLLTCQRDDGFYVLDKSLLVEKKDRYHLYAGGHMGLGEERKSKNWLKIESTFWVLRILFNVERNSEDISL